MWILERLNAGRVFVLSQRRWVARGSDKSEDGLRRKPSGLRGQNALKMWVELIFASGRQEGKDDGAPRWP